MTTEREPLELRDSVRRYWYDEEIGAIRIELYVSDYLHSLADAHEEFEFFGRVMDATGEKICILSWPKGFRGHEKEAAEFVASAPMARRVAVIVTVVEGAIKRAILDILRRFRGPSFMLEFAKCEQDAIRRLGELKKQYATERNLVMVADDQEDPRFLHSEMATMAGFRVVEARSASEVRTLLKSAQTGHRPRFIFSDYNMEGRGDFKNVALHVRDHSPFSRLFCVSSEHPGDVEAPQAERILQKPVDLMRLLSELVRPVEAKF